MKIVCSRFFVEVDLAYLKSKVPNAEFIVPSDFTDKGILEACGEGVDVFLGPPPSEKVLEKVTHQLKFIQIPWAGVEAIDFSACKKLNITCLNSHSNSECVAEFAVGLLFSLLKQIPFHNSELKQGKWHRPADPEGFFPPAVLKGKTIGYFGFGQINQNIQHMLSGFKLEHIACVTSQREKDGIKFFDFSEVDKFVSKCDIIFIGAPITDKTEGIFDEHLLGRMKKGGYLVNVSRAKIISEQALVKALNSNLSGAAMDVWYSYPKRGESRSFPCSDELLECTNLIASPHRAGYVKGELPHLNDAVDNLISMTQGDDLKNFINLEEKY